MHNIAHIDVFKTFLKVREAAKKYKSTYLPPFWFFLMKLFASPQIFIQWDHPPPKKNKKISILPQISQLNFHFPQNYHIWTTIPPKIIN